MATVEFLLLGGVTAVYVYPWRTHVEIHAIREAIESNSPNSWE